MQNLHLLRNRKEGIRKREQKEGLINMIRVTYKQLGELIEMIDKKEKEKNKEKLENRP